MTRVWWWGSPWWSMTVRWRLPQNVLDLFELGDRVEYHLRRENP